MQPLVTIVTNYHNRAGFLKETLRSLQLQTMTDWEAILWNDGSTDNSEEIAREIAGTDSRFRFFGGERIGQGRENAKQFLREHPEIAKKIEAKVLAHHGVKRDLGTPGVAVVTGVAVPKPGQPDKKR